MAPRKRKQIRAAAGLKWGEGFVEEIPRDDGTIRYKARWQEERDDGTMKLAAKSFNDRDSAENHLRDIYRAKRDGRYVRASEMSVADAINDYLDRGTGRWKPSSHATYSQRARNHILPRIGDMQLSELTTADVQRWIDRLMRSGLSAKTVEESARVLGGAMREAVRLGLINTNPVSNTRRPTTPATERTIWTPDEISRALTATKKNTKYHALYHVALMTGMRPGELRALQWPDIDLDKRTVNVRRTITRDSNNRDVVGTSTKTGRVRTIALPEAAISVLRRWRAEQNRERLAAATWDDRQFVFTGAGGRFLGATTWQHRHAEIIRRAGVTTITLHGLRHSFATAMVANNVHPLVLSRILGHSKIETTLNIYAHPDDTLQRAAIDAFGTRLTESSKATTSGDSG